MNKSARSLPDLVNCVFKEPTMRNELLYKRIREGLRLRKPMEVDAYGKSHLEMDHLLVKHYSQGQIKQISQFNDKRLLLIWTMKPQ